MSDANRVQRPGPDGEMYELRIAERGGLAMCLPPNVDIRRIPVDPPTWGIDLYRAGVPHPVSEQSYAGAAREASQLTDAEINSAISTYLQEAR